MTEPDEEIMRAFREQVERSRRLSVSLCPQNQGPDRQHDLEVNPIINHHGATVQITCNRCPLKMFMHPATFEAIFAVPFQVLLDQSRQT